MIEKVVINEEGEILIQEFPLGDFELGKAILSNLKIQNNFSYHSHHQDRIFQIENFDEPLVVRSIEVKKSLLVLNFPYSYSISIKLEHLSGLTPKPFSLSLDPWDRVHGRTENSVAFVFSRTAQEQLFEASDEFDDDSITLGGNRIDLGPCWNVDSQFTKASFWSEKYDTKETPWDLGEVHPQFAIIWPRLKRPRSRILVLGCGAGHDAYYLAEKGHRVTAVDHSETALQKAKEKYGEHEGLVWRNADALKEIENFEGAFDVVVEHTLFCAINPASRNELVKIWRKYLTSDGILLAVFFVNDMPLGPPYGATEWEIRKRLEKSFKVQLWGRTEMSPERLEGTELFVLASKRKI